MNDSYYHVFNRGVEKRLTFMNRRELSRALELLYFYQFSLTPVRFSYFKDLSVDKQRNIIEVMIASGKIADVIAYCLMPNHFHLLLKQRKENGIPTFISNFTNAYTKYFNTKNDRVGPLFQGIFKAVFVETDEQLIHLTRYIHINPFVSSIVELTNLRNYPWSSYRAYISEEKDSMLNGEEVEKMRKLIPNYESFVMDHASYAREISFINHLIIE